MRRWNVFLCVFVLTSIAVVLDLVTTYLGFRRTGTRFEENAIALFLIQHIGWVGIGALTAAVCALCFSSFKRVYWNLSLHWSFWLNILAAIVCVFRWTVVVADIAWLIRT